jgi:hypothetical protein
MVALLKSPRPSLRLVPGDGHDDRRIFPRKPAHGPVSARRLDHSLRARLNPALTLHLKDLSAGGLAASSPTPLTPNEQVALAFPSNHPHPGFDACARVLRCTPTGNGYSVALAFDPLPAA